MRTLSRTLLVVSSSVEWMMDGTPELAGLQREWYYKTKCGNEDFFPLQCQRCL